MFSWCLVHVSTFCQAHKAHDIKKHACHCCAIQSILQIKWPALVSLAKGNQNNITHIVVRVRVIISNNNAHFIVNYDSSKGYLKAM